MSPDIQDIYAVTEATWPAADRHRAGPWVLRNGAGGGQRVSAATLEGRFRPDDLSAAEEAMRFMGQTPLFMIRQGDDTLDQALAGRGYAIKDPVNAWCGPVTDLTRMSVPPVTAFCIWEPLAIMREIWAAGGIGPARIRVMERVQGPKTGIFGRTNEKPAAAGFCAIHDGVAMVHALEVAAPHRGKGLGRWMMAQAGHWAAGQGADWMSVLCTQANSAANGLYASLGMQLVGQYHYRILPVPAEES